MVKLYVNAAANSEGLDAFHISNGVLESADPDYLMSLPNGILDIPSNLGITKIGADCFSNNLYIKDVRIPEGVEAIIHNAFAGCKNLKSVDLPNGLEVISADAFSDCGLKQITIPSSVKRLEHAFTDCENLRFVEIQGDVTAISYVSFLGCKSLKDIKMSTATIAEFCWSAESALRSRGIYWYEKKGDIFGLPETCCINGVPATKYGLECVEHVEAEIAARRQREKQEQQDWESLWGSSEELPHGRYNSSQQALIVKLPRKLSNFLNYGEVTLLDIEEFIENYTFMDGYEVSGNKYGNCVIVTPVTAAQSKSLGNSIYKALIALQRDI